jgi:hypothetical protein
VAAALLDLAETELDRGDQAAARCLLVERDEVLRRLGRSAEAGQSELMDLFTELFRRRDEEEDPRT